MIDPQLQQTLAQLKDIHLPNDSLFWPPAPGTSLVIIVIAFAFVYIIKKIITAVYNRYKFRLKQLALKELNRLEQNIGVQDLILLTQSINLLLKKCAITKFSLSKDTKVTKYIHSLSGQQWLEFLNETGNTKEFSTDTGALLITLPYQKNLKPENNSQLQDKIKHLITLTKQWIKINL